MDRKIELDTITEEMFNDLMSTVSAEVLTIGKEAQGKINELLVRFNIRCDLTLNYSILSTENTAVLINNLPTEKLEEKEESITPIKKKRASRKADI